MFIVQVVREVVSDYRDLGGDVERDVEKVCNTFDNLNDALVMFLQYEKEDGLWSLSLTKQ